MTITIPRHSKNNAKLCERKIIAYLPITDTLIAQQPIATLHTITDGRYCQIMHTNEKKNTCVARLLVCGQLTKKRKKNNIETQSP